MDKKAVDSLTEKLTELLQFLAGHGDNTDLEAFEREKVSFLKGLLSEYRSLRGLVTRASQGTDFLKFRDFISFHDNGQPTPRFPHGWGLLTRAELPVRLQEIISSGSAIEIFKEFLSADYVPPQAHDLLERHLECLVLYEMFASKLPRPLTSKIDTALLKVAYQTGIMIMTLRKRGAGYERSRKANTIQKASKKAWQEEIFKRYMDRFNRQGRSWTRHSASTQADLIIEDLKEMANEMPGKDTIRKYLGRLKREELAGKP